MQKKTVSLIAFLLGIVLVMAPNTYALTPNDWQQNATGLRTQNNTDKKTAGLGFILSDKSWPFLSTQGGVQDDGYNRAGGFVDIEFGLLKIPNAASSTFSSESANWSGNALTYNSGTANQIKTWVSRQSPAVLVQTAATQLRLFSGNVNQYVRYDLTGLTTKSAPSSPKYVAYSANGIITIKALTTTSTPLPSIDNGWIVVWYGKNSHFYDSKLPLKNPFPYKKGCCGDNFGGSLAYTDVYQSDVPILLKFQNNPTAIVKSSEGGIDLTFATGSGYTSILPLLGRDHPAAATTDTWTTALPTNVIQKINFWTSRLCNFPSAVTETYNYDTPSNTATITDSITYIQACASGSKFAVISPMLALAKDSVGVSFSTALVDGNLPTEFGPTLGVEDADSYSWSVNGLNKYTSFAPNLGPNGIPSYITSVLNLEVDKITQAGHYSPWLVADRMSRQVDVGDIYFLNPADSISLLTQVIPALSEPQKTNLTNYLIAERTNFPPETLFNLTMGQGTIRGDFNPPNQTVPGTPSQLYQRWAAIRPDVYMKRVWLYNFYSLSKYYALLGQTPPASVMTAALDTLDKDMTEMDFATMYWFKGFDDRVTAVNNANREIAGIIGFTRLAKVTGDTASENLGQTLLAKAIVLRVGMAKYPRYLYANNLVSLPADPAWQPKYLASSGYPGLVFNYNWTSGADDARQVTLLSQYGLTLYDQTGYLVPFTQLQYYNKWASSSLSAFRDMVPETGLILKDFAKADSEIYIKKVETLIPHWYAAFIESYLSVEHNISYPIDSYQLFMAKKMIQDETDTNLLHYLDIPFLSSGGDFYYLHKAAEVAFSYSVDDGSTLPTPTPTLQPSPSATPTSIPNQTPTPTLTPTPTSVPNSVAKDVYRLLHPQIHYHFYTNNATVRDYVIQTYGYVTDGTTFKAFANATDDTQAQPVYDTYNQYGDHFYTISAAEKDAVVQSYGYTYVGIAFYAYPTAGPNRAPVYRLTNSVFDHFYTASTTERDGAITYYGYHLETTAFYAPL